jgi:hypothetical protein
MSVSLQELRQASYRFTRRTFAEAVAARIQTAFLCHSHKDSDLAKGLQVELLEHGWDLYIDWDDDEMPEKPDRTTARRIQSKIKSCDWFLYLATPNSSTSRWCPWEIGYADGVKIIDKILIVATHDGSHTYGAEYLNLYRQVSTTTKGGWGLFEAGTSTDGQVVSSITR